MQLKTILSLNAAFPLLVPLAIILMIKWRFGPLSALSDRDLDLVAVLAAGAVGLSAVVMSFNRRILQRINQLNEWTESILAGNIDSKIDVPPNDGEVTRLAYAFEKIISDLKDSYANLYSEVLSHKERAKVLEQRAAASQIGAKHLSEALGRLKQAQDKALTEERGKTLEQVVRGVTHDVSEALTPIMATTDLLLSRPELLEQKEALLDHIRSVRQSAEQGREVVRHLAGYFHQVPIEQDNVDMYYVVLAAIAEVEQAWRSQPHGPANKITLRTNLDIVPSITGNVGGLRSAIVDLLTNAFEAMPDGGAITVVTRATPAHVIVEINDTGKGMDNAVLARASEPFFTTKGSEHKGMGLTRVTSTVRSHGGDIRIESEAGAGTRIMFLLPIGQPAAAVSENVVDASPDATGALDIIVVDDDKATRDVVSLIIGTHGHAVTVTAEATECLERMREKSFDVVILDLDMPGMRGDELAANIARNYPKVAIVMFTGFGGIMMEEGSIPEHVDVLVAKPVASNELVGAVSRALKVHREGGPKRRKPALPAQQGNASRINRTLVNERTFTWHG